MDIFRSCKEEKEEKQIQVSSAVELNHTFIVCPVSFHKDFSSLL